MKKFSMQVIPTQKYDVYIEIRDGHSRLFKQKDEFGGTLIVATSYAVEPGSPPCPVRSRA